MKSVIELEHIGDVPPRFRPWLAQVIRHTNTAWVAQITGLDARYGLARRFIRPLTDFSRANSVGSRGVYGYYILDDGIYEVNRRLSWRNCRRYFVRAQDGQVAEISREEVMQCLANGCSASMS